MIVPMSLPLAVVQGFARGFGGSTALSGPGWPDRPADAAVVVTFCDVNRVLPVTLRPGHLSVKARLVAGGGAGFPAAAPPLLPSSHRRTQQLATEPSPADDTAYRHREDLIDAVVCAWTAALWSRHGPARCQVLGLPDPPGSPSAATIIAPDRPERR